MTDIPDHPTLASRVLARVLGTAPRKLRPIPAHELAATEAVTSAVSRARLEAHVRAMPGPRSRLPGRSAAHLARLRQTEAHLERSLAAAGWHVTAQNYRLTNVHAYSDDGHEKQAKVYPVLDGRNLVAVKRGTTQPDHAVLVLAHMDTVRDSPGANDNGASMAGALELARALGPHAFGKTIVLAFVDHEEIGLVGSGQLAPRLGREYAAVEAIAFDTMAVTNQAARSQLVPRGMARLFPHQSSQIARGKYRGDFSLVMHNGASTDLAYHVAEGIQHFRPDHVAAPVVLRDPSDRPLTGSLLKRFVPDLRNFARSDHTHFQRPAKRMVGMMVNDGANTRISPLGAPTYHAARDTPDHVDYAALAGIVRGSAFAIARVAGLRGR